MSQPESNPDFLNNAEGGEALDFNPPPQGINDSEHFSGDDELMDLVDNIETKKENKQAP